MCRLETSRGTLQNATTHYALALSPTVAAKIREKRRSRSSVRDVVGPFWAAVENGGAYGGLRGKFLLSLWTQGAPFKVVKLLITLIFRCLYANENTTYTYNI